MLVTQPQGSRVEPLSHKHGGGITYNFILRSHPSDVIENVRCQTRGLLNEERYTLVGGMCHGAYNPFGFDGKLDGKNYRHKKDV